MLRQDGRRMLCSAGVWGSTLLLRGQLTWTLLSDTLQVGPRHQQVAHPAVTRPGRAVAKINESLNDGTLNFHQQQNLTASRSVHKLLVRITVTTTKMKPLTLIHFKMFVRKVKVKTMRGIIISHYILITTSCPYYNVKLS